MLSHYDGGGKVEVSISRDCSAIVLDGLISGPEGEHMVQFLLDTGASITMVPSKVLEKIGSMDNVIEDSISIKTASGTVHVNIVKVGRIEILGEIVEGIEVACYDIPPQTRVEALLGLNFLKHFKMTLDFPNGKLRLEANDIMVR